MIQTSELPRVSTELDEDAINIDPRSPDEIREEMNRRRLEQRKSTMESLESALEEKLLKEAAEARTIPPAEMPPAWKRSDERKKKLAGAMHPNAKSFRSSRPKQLTEQEIANKYYNLGKEQAGQEGLIVGVISTLVVVGTIFGGYKLYGYMTAPRAAARVAAKTIA